MDGIDEELRFIPPPSAASAHDTIDKVIERFLGRDFLEPEELIAADPTTSVIDNFDKVLQHALSMTASMRVILYYELREALAKLDGTEVMRMQIIGEWLELRHLSDKVRMDLHLELSRLLEHNTQLDDYYGDAGSHWKTARRIGYQLDQSLRPAASRQMGG